MLIALSFNAFSQQFEPPHDSGEGFEKLNVKVGGDFALQYQALDHHADSALIPLGSGVNLPTANLNVDAYLAPGIRLNLVTYLSSRHHNDAWVKGGYLQIDQLPFIKSQAVDKAMDYLTIRAGDMELNYGDAHFRRTDNGKATSNPFVGNYIMDAFTTSPALEILYRNNGILAMGGLTEGSLNPALVKYSGGTYTAYDAPKYLGYYWKAGFDRNFSEDFRLRLTVSGYFTPEHYSGSLYNGDRAGSRYYLVMNRITNSSGDVSISGSPKSGRWAPGTTNKDNSLMFNLYTKYRGFEFFGTFESASGTYSSDTEFKFSQIGTEALYRFGSDEQFYGGVRYNRVNGDTDVAISGDQSVSRFQAGAGWFILNSTVLKLEYVNQDYSDFIAEYGSDAGFNGLMIEAAVSF